MGLAQVHEGASAYLDGECGAIFAQIKCLALERVTSLDRMSKEVQYGFPVVPTLHLLGDFRLIWGETPVMNIDMPRMQSLLAYLVLHQNAPQSRSQLAFLLWSDTTDSQAHTNLRNLLFKLRKVLPSVDLLWISKAGHLYVLRRANQNGCGAMVSRKREATTCAG